MPNTLDEGAGGVGLFTVTEQGIYRGGRGVCIHYVYAALRPKSNEKAATITEYKTRAKQNSKQSNNNNENNNKWNNKK